jgi:hypothetical protein
MMANMRGSMEDHPREKMWDFDVLQAYLYIHPPEFQKNYEAYASMGYCGSQ